MEWEPFSQYDNDDFFQISYVPDDQPAQPQLPDVSDPDYNYQFKDIETARDHVRNLNYKGMIYCSAELLKYIRVDHRRRTPTIDINYFPNKQ